MGRMLRVLVTGQSPRPDIVAQISAAVSGVEIVVEGALDGMSRDQIVARAPLGSDDDMLFTRLSSGEIAKVSRTMIASRFTACLHKHGPTLLWSTTIFRDLVRRDDVVQPSDLLTAMVDVLLPVGTLGLIVPWDQRLEIQAKERFRPGLRVVPEVLVPWSDCAAIDAAAFRLLAQRPDIVLMDSMSYTRPEMLRVSAIVSCLVLLPSAAATGAVAVLLDATGIAPPVPQQGT